MCLSLRGGAYYGASLHITIGLIFLGGFFVDLLGVAEIWHNPYATYFTLILAFIYICLFIIFGLLIFRGTEKESTKLLKGSIAGFVALQISAFFVYLIILAITNSIKNSKLAEASSNSTDSSTTPFPDDDLKDIEIILEEASEEFRLNNTSGSVAIFEDIEPVDIPPSTVTIIHSTPMPSLNSERDLSLLDDGLAVITVYQVIIIVLGGLSTLIYTAVVIMYFREIDIEITRTRPIRY